MVRQTGLVGGEGRRTYLVAIRAGGGGARGSKVQRIG